MLTQIFRSDYESGGIYYKDPITGTVNGAGVLVGATTDVLSNSKYAPLKTHAERPMPRVESETSDLGEDGEAGICPSSFQNTPRSSVIDLRLDAGDEAELGRSLLRAPETHI